MTSNTTNRRGNMGAMIRALRPLGPAATNDPHKNRQLVADFCRLVGANLSSASPGADLPPRVRQTLTSLLNGASEKEIASTLRLSHHTVHVYVKQIYKHYGVSSRAELLARWVKP